MTDSSATADAVAAAPNHAEGHRWTATGTVEVPFTPLAPYVYARRRRDQLHGRGHGALAAPPTRGRQHRGDAHRLARESRGNANREGRGERQGRLRNGLGHPGDA